MAAFICISRCLAEILSGIKVGLADDVEPIAVQVA